VARVNFYAAAKAVVGTAELKVPASSIGELISSLSQLSPEMTKLLPTCSYLLNGESCTNLAQSLSDDDQVDVLPQFAGG
jgi:molybdopterin converting factor small subunit